MNITENQFITFLPENETNTINDLAELRKKKEIEKCFKIIEELKNDTNFSKKGKSCLLYLEYCIYIEKGQLEEAIKSIIKALNYNPTFELFQKGYTRALSILRKNNGFLACKDYIQDSFLYTFFGSSKYILEFLTMKIKFEEGNFMEAYDFSERSIITFQKLSENEKKEIMDNIELLKDYAFYDYIKFSYQNYKNLLNSNKLNDANSFYSNVLNKLIDDDIKNLWILNCQKLKN